MKGRGEFPGFNYKESPDIWGFIFFGLQALEGDLVKQEDKQMFRP